MITTDFVTGSPCWLDLGVPDVTAAAEFYSNVFDWSFEPMSEEEAGGYGVFRLRGKAVAAVGPLTEESARSAWMVYFDTPDADDTVSTVERSGGSVRVPPMDADGEGRMAQFTDPLGGEFAVWQPQQNPGLQLVDQPGSLCWVELCTTDAERAKDFYGGLFNWRVDDMPMPGGEGTYSVLIPAGKSPERGQGGIAQLPADALTMTGGRPYWHPVFATADCDATVARVTEHGGTIQMGPEDMEMVGRLAVCRDPWGAEFVLLTPSEQEGGEQS